MHGCRSPVQRSPQPQGFRAADQAAAQAQVDLGERGHGHQDTAALGRMAATIIQTLTARLGPSRPEGHELVQFSRVEGEVVPVTWEIPFEERPPMITLPSYQATRKATSTLR